MTKPDLDLTDFGSSGGIGGGEETSKIGISIAIESEILRWANDHSFIARPKEISSDSLECDTVRSPRVDREARALVVRQGDLTSGIGGDVENLAEDGAIVESMIIEWGTCFEWSKDFGRGGDFCRSGVCETKVDKDEFDETSLGHEKGAFWLNDDVDAEVSRVVCFDPKVELAALHCTVQPLVTVDSILYY